MLKKYHNPSKHAHVGPLWVGMALLWAGQTHMNPSQVLNGTAHIGP